VDLGKPKDYVGAHSCHLENTTEPSVCGGDEAFLSNYTDYLLLLLQMN